MNERGGYTPESATPRHIELRQLTSAENAPNPTTVFYVPPVMGDFPSEQSLSYFSQSGSSVLGVDIHQYGDPLDVYAEQISQEVQKKEHYDPKKTYVVGYSNGGGFAAAAGIYLGLPKEQILIVAPILSIPKLIKRQGRDTITKLAHPRSETERMHTGFDLQHAKKMAGLLRHKKHWTQFEHMKQFAIPTKAQLEKVTIVSGGTDSISPPTEQTGIVVENAGHRFADFAPTIATYIATSSS